MSVESLFKGRVKVASSSRSRRRSGSRSDHKNKTSDKINGKNTKT